MHDIALHVDLLLAILKGIHNIIWKCLMQDKVRELYPKLHTQPIESHLNSEATIRKITQDKHYWKMLHRDFHTYFRLCHACQVHTPFVKFGIALLKPIPTPWHHS
jgi:hypothetical protein